MAIKPPLRCEFVLEELSALPNNLEHVRKRRAIETGDNGTGGSTLRQVDQRALGCAGLRLASRFWEKGRRRGAVGAAGG
jgi:hypothetical protein